MAKQLNGATKLSKFPLNAESRYERPSPGFIAVLIAIGVAGRLLPHLPNVTPIGGLAIWGGIRFGRQWNIAIVLAAMFVSDLFLGSHRTMGYVYGSLVLITWLASIIKRVHVGSIAGVTLLSSLLFFIITNFGVWQTSSLYPPTWQGLMQSYIAALPFLRASLLGDIAYTALFFTAEWVTFTLWQKRRIVKSVLF